MARKPTDGDSLHRDKDSKTRVTLQGIRRDMRISFEDAARALECDESEERFNAVLGQIVRPKTASVCPECGHVFQGNGWDGIDAHWRSKHNAVMPYEEAWPLIKAGKYKPAK